MSKHISAPINRKLEQYLSIHNGVILISPDNRIVLKLFLNSEIDVEIDEIKAHIIITNINGESQTLEKSIAGEEIREGEVNWEFFYDCVRINIFNS